MVGRGEEKRQVTERVHGGVQENLRTEPDKEIKTRKSIGSIIKEMYLVVAVASVALLTICV
jgi:hypothetical protein